MAKMALSLVANVSTMEPDYQFVSLKINVTVVIVIIIGIPITVNGKKFANLKIYFKL